MAMSAPGLWKPQARLVRARTWVLVASTRAGGAGLQVIGHSQPRVGPRASRHERQVVIQQPMAKRDRLDPAARHRAVKAGMNSNGWLPSGRVTRRATRSCHCLWITRI